MKRHRLLRRNITLALCGMLLALLLSSAALAQTGTSSVRGTVTDPQGNVIAGATVTLTNTETNVSRNQTTTDTGTYVFDFVPPGDYRVEVEAQGFKKSVVNDVHALISQPTPADVQLEVGSVSETVTVTAGAEALINREDATLGNVFVNRQVTQLPIENRNIPGLLTLQPGVTRGGSVTGARADQNNITLDGVDINEQQTNTVGTANDNPTTAQQPTNNTVLRLNAEAIEEFRVVTSNPTASQGRSSGAQVALVTKSGTNDLNGTLFWFHRPTKLTANDFFNNRNNIRRPTLIRNVFGGAVGGPIVKDRAFFFYSYEGRRQVSQTTVVRTVPLPSLGQGQVRYVNPSGGITTLSAANLATIFPSLGGTNPAAVAVLADAARRYPANDFTVGDSQPNRLLNVAGYRFNAPTPVQLNSHVGRFDLNLTDKQQLFARSNVIYDLTSLTPQFPDTPSPSVWSHPWGVAAGHTWAISNNLVNNFRYGFTREAFTQQGDSAANAITFRFVYSPLLFTRTLSRITPVHNFTDDVSWIKGAHTFQFGANVRVIRNNRGSFSTAFDSAVTNPSFYAGAGSTLSNAINGFSTLGSGMDAVVQNAATAVLGRFSQYTANFTFDQQGSLLPPGSPTVRDLATEEYETYFQDSWKIRPNLTLTYGLRYSISRPVYETQGFEVKPRTALGEYFRLREENAQRGVNFTDPIVFEPSGPANNQSPLYRWDKNNFQPRVAVAWSPGFKDGFLGTLFGRNSESVVRAGFAMTNDAYGQQLAVSFDLLNSLGFVSNTTIAANTYNTTTNPAPLFTGFGQGVRGLPRITVPGRLTFPLQFPLDFNRRIEFAFDEDIKAPTHYNWNLTFERALPKGLVIQASYIGRAARDLLASRDIAQLINLVDSRSGADWYTAAGTLEDLRAAATPVSSVQAIPYFENLFPNLATLYRSLYTSYYGAATANSVFAGVTNSTQAVYASALRFNANDWTTVQDDLENALGRSFFYQEQYGSLYAWGNQAYSNYHAGTISVRERLGSDLLLDFNYTLSHSHDNTSALFTEGYTGGGLILNPFRPDDRYANSDFDVRHIINVNGVWQLPFGRGRRFLNSGGISDVLLGGWQLSGIYRWNSGLPIGSVSAYGNPFDNARWATNWNFQSNGVRIRPVETCPTRGDASSPPRLFGCNQVEAYQSFRSPRPGESGDRNVLRLPGYVALDMGLAKSFTMPWSERHKLQLRFEAFNITNTQRLGPFDTSRTGLGLSIDPFRRNPPLNWTNFTGIQGKPREMQFGFRYEF